MSIISLCQIGFDLCKAWMFSTPVGVMGEHRVDYEAKEHAAFVEHVKTCEICKQGMKQEEK